MAFFPFSDDDQPPWKKKKKSAALDQLFGEALEVKAETRFSREKASGEVMRYKRDNKY